MRDNLKICKNIFSYINKTTFSKILIIAFSILTMYYGTLISIAYSTSNNNFFDLIITVFNNNNYLLVILFLFLINTIYTYQLLKNNIFYKMRFKNNSNYLKNTTLIVLFQNTFLFIINLLLLMICINLFCDCNYSLELIESYNIYNIFYFIWYLLRYFIWIEILSIFQIIISNKIPSKLVFIITFICYMAIYFNSLYQIDYVISSINDIKLSIFMFFITIPYTSFIFEIVISCFYILFFLLLIKMINKTLFFVDQNHIKRKLKFLFHIIKNDINAIIHQFKWMPIVYIFVLISVLFWFYDGKNLILGKEQFKYIFGLSYKYENGIFELILLLVNWLAYIYLALNLLFKDIKLQATNLFLRLLPKKYILSKIISLINITFIIKFLNYLIMFVIFNLVSHLDLSTIIFYFCKDLLFTINIEFLSIIYLFLNYSYPKLKLLTFLALIVLIRFLLVPIVKIPFYIIIILLLIETLALALIFNKNSKCIFENIENGG